MTPKGYTETPLAKKLGIKEKSHLLLYNPPLHYFDLFSDLPPQLNVSENISSKEVDFIHLFCTSFEELKIIVPKYKKVLKKSGLLWISWPKGTSKIDTDLKRDPIRALVLETGLVDVKVAAIDKDWSGLKFVSRLKDR